MTKEVKKYNAEFERLSAGIKRFIRQAAILKMPVRSVNWQRNNDGGASLKVRNMRTEAF